VLIRAGFCVLAILCALVIGRYTVPEPEPRVERVRDVVYVTQPPPVPKPGLKRRATLEDVRRDWGLTGRLVCHTEIP
jgi:hypothetical protein